MTEPLNGGSVLMGPAQDGAGEYFSPQNRTWTFRKSGHIELGCTSEFS